VSNGEPARARAIVAASADGGAARLGSEMIDAPVLDRARRLVAEADQADQAVTS